MDILNKLRFYDMIKEKDRLFLLEYIRFMLVSGYSFGIYIEDNDGKKVDVLWCCSRCDNLDISIDHNGILSVECFDSGEIFVGEKLRERVKKMMVEGCCGFLG